MDLVQLEKSLTKAKVHLMYSAESDFFIKICFSLVMLWDTSISTAATNGKKILINPNYWFALSVDEQVFLLLHESMHVAYLHIFRGTGLIHEKYNAAADYVINLHLVTAGFRMPKGGLLNRDYKDMSTEQVYALLPDSTKCPEPDLLTPEGDAKELEKEVEDLVVQAAMQAKMNGKPGTVPGEIQIFLNKLLNPRLPWQKLLMRYVNSYNQDDFSFKKFNRRLFPEYILPGLHSETLGNMMIAVDTSGSVEQEHFDVFVSEICGIFRMMKPKKITLIQFDTRIRGVNNLVKLQDMKDVKFSGRGGTNIGPVINWINENKPQLTLIFTDGEFYFYDNETRQDIIWLINNNDSFNSKFGKVINYNI